MATISQTGVASAFGINVVAVWSLSGNPQFPRPVSGSDQNVLWDSAAFATFQALWTSAVGRGWKISAADLPVANFAAMAAANPGPYYSPPLVDQLFDNFP